MREAGDDALPLMVAQDLAKLSRETLQQFTEQTARYDAVVGARYLQRLRCAMVRDVLHPALASLLKRRFDQTFTELRPTGWLQPVRLLIPLHHTHCPYSQQTLDLCSIYVHTSLVRAESFSIDSVLVHQDSGDDR